MEIDEGLAERVRQTLFALAEFADISERKMFGGLVIMVNGHMTCGLSDAVMKGAATMGLCCALAQIAMKKHCAIPIVEK